jgi:hypothetical protein
MILFIGPRSDLILMAMDRALAQPTEVLWLEEDQLFSNVRFAFERQGKRTGGYFAHNLRVTNFDDLDGICVRMRRDWWPGRDFDPQDQMFVYHERTAAWFSILSAVSQPVINQFPLAWWLQDLTYPETLRIELAGVLNMAARPLTPTVPYTVQLLPSLPDSSIDATHVYLAGDEIIAPPNGSEVVGRLRRRGKVLKQWQAERGIAFCRLDIQRNGKDRLMHVEVFPLMEGEDTVVTGKVGAALAERLL